MAAAWELCRIHRQIDYNTLSCCIGNKTCILYLYLYMYNREVLSCVLVFCTNRKIDCISYSVVYYCS